MTNLRYPSAVVLAFCTFACGDGPSAGESTSADTDAGHTDAAGPGAGPDGGSPLSDGGGGKGPGSKNDSGGGGGTDGGGPGGGDAGPGGGGPITPQANTLYVSPTGSDSNPGTQASPFKTIGKGVSAASAGTDVIVRAGTYSEAVKITKSGTSGSPIRLYVYSGESATIDASGGSDGVSISGDYVTVSGFEVAKAGGAGISSTGKYTTVSHNKVHDAYYQGILLAGDNSVGEYNIVANNVQQNNCGKSSGWASGMSAARAPTGVTLRYNVVYGNWGEGLSTYEDDTTTINGNVVYDNFSVNMYIQNSPHTTAYGNMVYNSSSGLWASCGKSGTVAVGIAIADEKTTGRTQDVKVYNNFVYGRNAFMYFMDGGGSASGLQNDVIEYNTFVSDDGVLSIDQGTHTGTTIRNNIFYARSGSIGNVSSSSGLTFSNNLWSSSPPSGASGSGDVSGNPQLAGTGGTGPGQLQPAWFELTAGSAARGKAAASSITTDFYGHARGSAPDIGGHQFGAN